MKDYPEVIVPLLDPTTLVVMDESAAGGHHAQALQLSTTGVNKGNPSRQDASASGTGKGSDQTVNRYCV